MKEIIEKKKNETQLPKKLLIDKTPITDQKQIAYKFHNFLRTFSPGLSSKIPKTSKSFDTFITKRRYSYVSRSFSSR